MVTKRKELSSIVSNWNETHPNRKDQPTLYFVIDNILQKIVNALDFDVFEENEQVVKFKCLNLPLIGELELKKKNNNLFLLLDLNKYSLVINGEERSKEYTITAFKDDYKNRVAEFVFLHYEELKEELSYLYLIYLYNSLELLYTKEIETRFVLEFNELLNKFEHFLNKIYSYLNMIIRNVPFENPIYGLSSSLKCANRLIYKYKNDDEDKDKVELKLDVLPIKSEIKDRKCFDAVFSFVKNNMNEQYKEYSLKDLMEEKAYICKGTVNFEFLYDTLIINKNTFKIIFPDRFFPQWCLMWWTCSIYITEEISDGNIIFIRAHDWITNRRNAICIDKENQRYFVNETSKLILAFKIFTKS